MRQAQTLLPDRPIAFNREFVRLGIRITGALFLSQAIYWSKRTKDPDGWFYKTVQEWEEETGITRDEQLRVKKVLQEKGLISIEKRGSPAKNYFKVNAEAVVEALIQSSGIPTTSRREKRRPVVGKSDDLLYTESTTESTNTCADKPRRKPAAKKPTTFNPDGAKVVEAFVAINPACKRHYGNTTQRRACDDLIESYGLDQTLMVIRDVLPKTNKRPRYEFPYISTPQELMRHWTRLEDGILSARDAKKEKSKVAFT